jgi:RNA polymerase sigma-70 factor (ECF subfamily)
MKTTHNLCIDFIRKNKKDSEKNPLSIDDINNYIDIKNEFNPTRIVENKLTDEKIKMAIKKLQENQKSVFVLYELQQMKYKEISKILDIPINSVKVYLMRARKNLQNELKKIDF